LAKGLRVFELAKELGVTSKIVLEKCRAEGLEIKNHMSTVTTGLSMTIREWFTEGSEEQSTIVETVAVEEAPVDLVKARREAKKKRRRKAEKEAQEQEQAEKEQAEKEKEKKEQAAAQLELERAAATEAAEQLAEEELAEFPDPVEEEAAEEAEDAVALEALDTVSPVEVEPEPATASAELTDTETLEADEAIVSEQPQEEPASSEPVASIEEEQPAEEPPEPVVLADEAAPEPPVEEGLSAAGPQNVPQPAQLQGPQVIRVDAPEVVSSPPPRYRPPAQSPREPVAPAAQDATTSSIVPDRKRKVAGGPAEDEAAQKRKARSPRRSGRADAGERMKEWRDRDLLERQERLVSATGIGMRVRRVSDRSSSPAPAQPGEKTGPIVLQEPILVRELCSAIGVGYGELNKKLMTEHEVMLGINQVIESEIALVLAMDYGTEIQVEAKKTALEKLEADLEQLPTGQQERRPPVVTFLGHVDHGKTSLLDAIRDTRVTEGESGGITQHVGAYRLDRGDVHVTFLDTPGHEAFTAMRARGANMTDVVVLVVAADDGVMPQTEEAINHARAAGVPIVVALNKIDLPESNVDRVFGQLSEKGVVPAEWGGDVDVIRTSATTGEGVDDLLEHLATLSELLELSAYEEGDARGRIIEASVAEGRGTVATLLVQNGVLKVGDVVVAGASFGRMRSMSDDRGATLESAGPGSPVVVSGLAEVPAAGDKFFVVTDLQRAKEVADESAQQQRTDSLARRSTVTLENLMSAIDSGQTNELLVVIKGDTQGTVDVLKDSCSQLGNDEVSVRVLHAGVGGISESDVVLAEASDAVIIGFHVLPESSARALAEERGVEIRTYRVIYDVTNDIRLALERMLSPTFEENVLGRLEVREIFHITGIGAVAGCYVTEGIIRRSGKVRVVRDLAVVRDNAQLASLRRFKDDVREVRNGLECGVRVEDFDDVKPADVIEVYEVKEVSRTL
jgi:translation initiation factor IF-2